MERQIYQLNPEFQVSQMSMELIRSDSVQKPPDFGTFWPWESRIHEEKKSNWIYPTYTGANILVNIFGEVGQVLREIRGGVRLLVVYGF